MGAAQKGRAPCCSCANDECVITAEQVCHTDDPCLSNVEHTTLSFWRCGRGSPIATVDQRYQTVNSSLDVDEERDSYTEYTSPRKTVSEGLQEMVPTPHDRRFQCPIGANMNGSKSSLSLASDQTSQYWSRYLRDLDADYDVAVLADPLLGLKKKKTRIARVDLTNLKHWQTVELQSPERLKQEALRYAYADAPLNTKNTQTRTSQATNESCPIRTYKQLKEQWYGEYHGSWKKSLVYRKEEQNIVDHKEEQNIVDHKDPKDEELAAVHASMQQMLHDLKKTQSWIRRGMPENLKVGMTYGEGTILEINPDLDKVTVAQEDGVIQHLKLSKVLAKIAHTDTEPESGVDVDRGKKKKVFFHTGFDDHGQTKLQRWRTKMGLDRLITNPLHQKHTSHLEVLAEEYALHEERAQPEERTEELTRSVLTDPRPKTYMPHYGQAHEAKDTWERHLPVEPRKGDLAHKRLDRKPLPKQYHL